MLAAGIIDLCAHESVFISHKNAGNKAHDRQKRASEWMKTLALFIYFIIIPMLFQWQIKKIAIQNHVEFNYIV